MSSESNQATLESPDASDAVDTTSTADAYATWKAAVIAEAKGEKSYPPSEKADLEWDAGLPAGAFDETVKLLRARFQGAANAESRRERERQRIAAQAEFAEVKQRRDAAYAAAMAELDAKMAGIRAEYDTAKVRYESLRGGERSPEELRLLKTYDPAIERQIQARQGRIEFLNGLVKYPYGELACDPEDRLRRPRLQIELHKAALAQLEAKPESQRDSSFPQQIESLRKQIAAIEAEAERRRTVVPAEIQRLAAEVEALFARQMEPLAIAWPVPEVHRGIARA